MKLEKENLISKLNIKNYNNQLEKILTKKDFSEDTKNLLLSMLYKVENAYDDYSTVNKDTKTKKETLEEILEIIEKNCEQIEIVKTRESKCIIEEKKIITYLNTQKILYEIYQIKQQKFKVFEQYEIIKPAIEEALNQGYSIASNEVIRDFDGWSWNIVTEDIDNLDINLIYQTLRILVGNDLLITWQENPNQDNISILVEKLEEKYKAELAEKLLKVISQVSILNIIKQKREEEKRLIKIQKQLQEQFNELDNKKEYLDKLRKKKKEISDEIKERDSIINNDRLLKKEFITRNEVLDMNHRIFSLSDLVEVLEKEREDLIEKLDECSKKMEPLNFVKTKIKIENKLILLKEIKLKSKQENIYGDKIKELLNLVCEAIKKQIEAAGEKESITKLIYKIRYYGLIYVSNDKQVKDIIDINKIQKMIITKACKEKIITIFSRNIKENYDIIKNILQTDIIDLEKIYFKFIKKEKTMLLEIYDEENMSKTLEIPTIEELNVKYNRKIKVFI